ncbi:MAG: divergent PAP2 family protein [Treponema sp.]|jgi:acid phosphatase family membrane protein YuiD|nr:divergent PAP2 family protein [Treponema sp.]
MTAVTEFKFLFGNIVFLSAFSSLCFSQILKMVVYLLTHKHKKPLEAVQLAIWSTGGMPSSHSALVCSLAASTGFKQGIASDFFIFSLVFALVVLRDSLGVRRAAGLQAKALNTLGKQASEKLGLEFNPVKEINGHSMLEVLIGGILGILIAIGFYLVFK